jgi:hypothetical protein
VLRCACIAEQNLTRQHAQMSGLAEIRALIDESSSAGDGERNARILPRSAPITEMAITQVIG